MKKMAAAFLMSLIIHGALLFLLDRHEDLSSELMTDGKNHIAVAMVRLGGDTGSAGNGETQDTVVPPRKIREMKMPAPSRVAAVIPPAQEPQEKETNSVETPVKKSSLPKPKAAKVKVKSAEEKTDKSDNRQDEDKEIHSTAPCKFFEKIGPTKNVCTVGESKDSQETGGHKFGGEIRGPRIVEAEEGKIVRKVKPLYPRISRMKRESGNVVLLATVEGGKAASVRVEFSSGYPRLDSSAVKAVSKWGFRYASGTTVRIPILFRLEDS